MNQQLYIPKTCKAGFQTTPNTLSKKLAYLIYRDEKNKLRKEVSWRNWINKNIPILDFDNDPIEGFILNRNVGNARTGWHHGTEKVRVKDPRGFDVEISVSNLLFILQETSTQKECLVGKFVYAWRGVDLVLLPVDSEDYKLSVKYTQLSHQKLTGKDLKLGHTYIDKTGKEYIYLGRYPYYQSKVFSARSISINWQKSNRYIFFSQGATLGLLSASILKEEKSAVIPTDLQQRIKDFINSPEASYPSEIITQPWKVPEMIPHSRNRFFLALNSKLTVVSLYGSTRNLITNYKIRVNAMCQERKADIDYDSEFKSLRIINLAYGGPVTTILDPVQKDSIFYEYVLKYHNGCIVRLNEIEKLYI